MCGPTASTISTRPEWKLLHDDYARLLSSCHEIIEKKLKKKKELLSHGITHSIRAALRTDSALVRLLAKSFPSERREDLDAFDGEGLVKIFENND